MRPRLYFITGVCPVWNEIRFGPSKPESHPECPVLRCRVRSRPGSSVTYEPGDTDRARRPRRLHQLVEHDCRLVRAAMPLGLEAHTIHGAVHFRHAADCLDPFGDAAALCLIDRLAAERTRMGEAFGD